MGGMAERWDVTSGDGESIAVWVDGEGPPLVLVHGSVSDHNVFAPLVGELRDEFTLFAMDRRGFGASRDGSGYSAEREFGDVAAVVEAVAARTGQPVVLFGSSWGAGCALGAARDLPTLRALILYEPSLGLRHAPGSLDRIEERIAAGDSEGVLIEMGTEAGLTEDQIAARRAAPNWSQRVASVPTVVREAHIEEGWNWPSDRFAGVGVSTLLLTGSETPHELSEITSMTAAAIPGAHVHVLAGHGHFAHVSDPGLVAQVLRDWLE
jgi:pimeloyl-ACP methyl ester carboxylesterase